jgi:hypothetical protein
VFLAKKDSDFLHNEVIRRLRRFSQISERQSFFF